MCKKYENEYHCQATTSNGPNGVYEGRVCADDEESAAEKFADDYLIVNGQACVTVRDIHGGGRPRVFLMERRYKIVKEVRDDQG